MPKLEIACFNAQSAFIAQQAGADRVELCKNFYQGGTTPDFKVVQEVRDKISIDLFVMIRPRGGDFIYSDFEFERMKLDIIHLKKLGVNGFVFGILTENNFINKKQNKELVSLAHPFPCTFHRAFDETIDYEKSLEDLINCGFCWLLTSGQKQNAVQGIEIIQMLIKIANNRIAIIPGGGVRSTNINILKGKINVPFFHSSAIIDNSEFASELEIKLLKEKLG